MSKAVKKIKKVVSKVVGGASKIMGGGGEDVAKKQAKQFAAQQKQMDKEKSDAAEKEKDRIRALAERGLTGRASTILTGATGLDEELGEARKKLLG